MSRLVVKISPFYTGRGWFDPKSGLNFLKQSGEIVIPEGKDLTNIKRDIRVNALIVVEGSVEEYENPKTAVPAAVEIEPVKVEAPIVEAEEPKAEEIKAEVKAEEAKVEEPVEVTAEEVPKPKPRVKKPAVKKEE